MKKNVHVTPRPDGMWQVKTEGSSRAHRIARTQGEAIGIGRQVAQRNRSEPLIHGTDGRIRDKRSYGNDSLPPRG